MNRWVLLACAIASEVIGSLSLKGALEQPLLYPLVAAGFTGGIVLLAAVLRAGMPLGVAYGVWAAFGVALTSVLSSIIYGEPFTPLMVAGIAVIVSGVLLVELGSHAATDQARGAG